MSSFELEIFFKFLLAWLAREKQNILTPQPCLHTLMQTLLSANQSARAILVILKIFLIQHISETQVLSLNQEDLLNVWLDH